MRYLISVAILALTIGLGFAFAQDSQPKVGQKFGDWAFQCSAVAQNQTDCAFVQTIVTPDAKRQLAQVQVLEQKAEPGTFIVSVLLPLGVDIQSAVTAKIDDAEPISTMLQTCVPRGCIATIPLDANLAGAMRTGSTLELAFTLAAGKKVVTVAGSLKGIDEAFTAAGWF